MGVGGGFVLVPAMIYLLRMPTRIVIGTSTFQIVCVTAFTTVLQSVQNHSVDVVLALPLIVGGVVGAQYGVGFGERLKAEQLRAGWRCWCSRWRCAWRSAWWCRRATSSRSRRRPFSDGRARRRPVHMLSAGKYLILLSLLVEPSGIEQLPGGRNFYLGACDSGTGSSQRCR